VRMRTEGAPDSGRGWAHDRARDRNWGVRSRAASGPLAVAQWVVGCKVFQAMAKAT
jgi:hypothetical protein